MHKLSVLCGALLLSSGSALAADAVLYSSAPAYDWSGLWIGGHAGYVSGHVIGYGGATSGPSGADVGVHGYYNFQHGNWVFGPYLGVPVVQKSGSVDSFITTKAEWAVTGGFRLGYAIDRWLPYGVIGGIVAGGKEDAGLAPMTNTHTGLAFILGVDYALTDRWAVGARYAHVSLGKEKYGGASSPIGWDGDSFVATLAFRLF